MTYRESLRQFRTNYWKSLLEACQGNVIATARSAGVNRTYLHRVIRNLHLQGFARRVQPVPVRKRQWNGPRVPGYIKPLKRRKLGAQAQNVKGPSHA